MEKDELNLRRLRSLVESAYDFLHDANGHPKVLLYGSVDAHIKEMWRLWNLLTDTWSEYRRYSKEFLSELCEDMRNMKIRTKGKIHPLKSINTIANQQNRLYAMTSPNSHRRQILDEIFCRYYTNIEQTKEYQNKFKEAYDFSYNDITCTHLRHEIKDAQAKTAGYAHADYLKFPKSIYAKQ